MGSHTVFSYSKRLVYGVVSPSYLICLFVFVDVLRIRFLCVGNSGTFAISTERVPSIPLAVISMTVIIYLNADYDGGATHFFYEEGPEVSFPLAFKSIKTLLVICRKANLSAL